MFEVVVSLAITSVIMTSVLVMYNQNFSLMHSSIEDSNKINTEILIKNKVKNTLTYNSNILIENYGDRLIIDGLTINFNTNKLEFIEGTDVMTIENVYKIGTETLFSQVSPYQLEMKYAIKNKHSTRNVIEKFTLRKNKYNKEFLNQ